MKTIFVTLALASAILFTGCNRAVVLKTHLESEEKLSKGDTVLVDGAVAGTVKKVAFDGDRRIAEFAITDEAVKSKLRVGLVRLREDGRVSLRTDTVDDQAPLLVNGGVVPLVSKTGFAIRRFTSPRVVPGLLVGLAVVLVALLLFRRFTRGWIVLLTLLLSGAVAWAALPWMTGAVMEVYSLVPARADGSGAAHLTGIPQSLSRYIENPPDPQAVAYASVFLLAFIILSVVLRSAINRLESRTCS